MAGMKSAYCGTSLIFDAVRRLLLSCSGRRRLIWSRWRAFTPTAYWGQLQQAQVRSTYRGSCRAFERKIEIGKLVRKDISRKKFPGLVLVVNSKLSHRCSQRIEKLYRRRDILTRFLSNSLEFCPSLYAHPRNAPPIDHTITRPSSSESP